MAAVAPAGKSKKKGGSLFDLLGEGDMDGAGEDDEDEDGGGLMVSLFGSSSVVAIGLFTSMRRGSTG